MANSQNFQDIFWRYDVQSHNVSYEAIHLYNICWANLNYQTIHVTQSPLSRSLWQTIIMEFRKAWNLPTFLNFSQDTYLSDGSMEFSPYNTPVIPPDFIEPSYIPYQFKVPYFVNKTMLTRPLPGRKTISYISNNLIVDHDISFSTAQALEYNGWSYDTSAEFRHHMDNIVKIRTAANLPCIVDLKYDACLG